MEQNVDVNRTSGYKVAQRAGISFLRAVTGYWMMHHTGSEDISE